MLKNVLKEDFYRLKYSKTFWICFGICAALSFFLVLVIDVSKEFVEEILQFDLDEVIFSEGIAAATYINVSVPLFCMILSAVLIPSEFSQGTMRQILAYGASRVGVYFSKWFKVFVASLSVFVVGIVVSYLAGLAFFSTNTSYLGEMFANIGFELLSLAGTSALYVALAFWFRSVGGVIGVGLAIELLGGIISNPLGTEQAVGGVLGVLNKLTLSGALSGVVENVYGTTEILYGIFVPVAYFMLFGVSGMLSFVKRDVK